MGIPSCILEEGKQHPGRKQMECSQPNQTSCSASRLRIVYRFSSLLNKKGAKEETCPPIDTKSWTHFLFLALFTLDGEVRRRQSPSEQLNDVPSDGTFLPLSSGSPWVHQLADAVIKSAPRSESHSLSAGETDSRQPGIGRETRAISTCGR